MARRAYFRDTLGVIIPPGVAAFTATQTPLSNAGGVAGGIVDLGAGRAEFSLILDVSALTVTADQSYDIIVQGSNSPTFASGIEELTRLRLGHTSTRNGAGTSLAGRYEIACNNERASVEYRYLRVVAVIAGTTPSITLGLWVSNLSPIQ